MTNQKQWDELKKFHNITDDTDMHRLLLDYIPMVNIPVSINGLRILIFALTEYHAEAPEASLKQRLIKELKQLENKTFRFIKEQ